MEPNLTVKNKLMQDAILRYLPIEIRNRVARKFPEFQDILNNCSYDLSILRIVLDGYDSMLTMSETTTGKKWVWKFRENPIPKRQEGIDGNDKMKMIRMHDLKNVDSFQLTGTVEENFQQLIDFILPKISSTLDKLEIKEKLPVMECSRKIKTRELSIESKYPVESLDRYMDMVDSAALESVTLIEISQCLFGNSLNHPLLEKCRLILYLSDFYVNNLANVASKEVKVVFVVPPFHLDNERISQLAEYFVETRSVGFQFQIEVRMCHQWSNEIEDIVKKTGWCFKYLCTLPCASYEYDNLEINIFFPQCSKRIQMEVMNRGTAKEKCRNEFANSFHPSRPRPHCSSSLNSFAQSLPSTCSTLKASPSSSHPARSYLDPLDYLKRSNTSESELNTGGDDKLEVGNRSQSLYQHNELPQ